MKDGHLLQITRDQTMAEELVDQGDVRSRRRATHWAHLLERDWRTASGACRRGFEQDWGSVGLICSDGLTRHISDDQIRARLLSMTSSRQACETLLQDALDAGGLDNITIIVAGKVRQNAGR